MWPLCNDCDISFISRFRRVRGAGWTERLCSDAMRYDGEIFTLIEAGPPCWQEAQDHPIEGACPEPSGGWERPDPDLSSEADYRHTIRTSGKNPISRAPGSTTPMSRRSSPTPRTSSALTGDLERHEREVRRNWGGPLCLMKREYTLKRLSKIQKELHDFVAHELDLDILWSDASEYRRGGGWRRVH